MTGQESNAGFVEILASKTLRSGGMLRVMLTNQILMIHDDGVLTCSSSVNSNIFSLNFGDGRRVNCKPESGGFKTKIQSTTVARG